MTGAVVAAVLATTWTLSVERDEKATTCPDEARLRRAVAERLGKDPFLEPTPGERTTKPSEPRGSGLTPTDSGATPRPPGSGLKDPTSDDPSQGPRRGVKDPYNEAPPPPSTGAATDDDLANPYAPQRQTRRAPSDHRQLLVRFARDGAGHVAVVSLRDESGRESGRRELTSPASDCAELAGAVVLSAAIVIDPLVLTRPAPVSAAPDAGAPEGWQTMPLSRPPDAQRPPPVRPGETPPSPPVWTPPPPPTATAPPAVDPYGLPPLPQPPASFASAPTAVRDAPARPPEPPPLNALFVGAGGGVSMLQVATVAALGQVQTSWTSRSAVVGLALGLTSPGQVPAGLGSVSAMLFDAGLHGCLRWKVLGGCALASVGTFQAWSEGLPNPRPQGATFATAGLGGLLDVRLSDAFRLRAMVAALLQPRITVSVGGLALFQTPAVGLTASVTVHFKAWGDAVP